jgi:hypothetical protein
MENIKEIILATLTAEFQTAGKIASLCSRNYYVVVETLKELLAENKIEKCQFNKRTKYRKPTQTAPLEVCPTATGGNNEKQISQIQ